MLKVVRKNKSYDKRRLKIYYHDKLINTVEPWGGWFCWEKKFENLMMHSACRRKVLENLYWLVGKDCDITEWSNRIDRWDSGRGVDGKTNKESVFFNLDDKITALESFNNI
jgi:hypothetical protein